MSDAVVYFVAVRTSEPKGSAEVSAAMRALNEGGLLAQPPLPDADFAVAWYRPYGELTANDNSRLQALGLDPEVAELLDELSELVSRSEFRVVEEIELDEEGNEWLTGASPPLYLQGARKLLASRHARGLTRSRLQLNCGQGWEDCPSLATPPSKEP